MSEYKKVLTSPEVWAVIHAKHRRELVPYSSFSNPTGTFCGGNGSKGEMFTSYGFEGADYPFIEANTEWDIDIANPHKRVNEEHTYWLCLPILEND